MSVRPKRREPTPWLEGWLDVVESRHADWAAAGLPQPSAAAIAALRSGRPADVQGVRLPRWVLIEHGLHPEHLWRFVTVHPDGAVTPADE